MAYENDEMDPPCRGGVMCALLALSTAACSQPVNMESGVITQDYPVTINEVTIDAKPQKVAVLSGSLADVVLAMGYETSLALASEDCTQPELEVLTKISATDSAAIPERRRGSGSR